MRHSQAFANFNLNSEKPIFQNLPLALNSNMSEGLLKTKTKTT